MRMECSPLTVVWSKGSTARVLKQVGSGTTQKYELHVMAKYVFNQGDRKGQYISNKRFSQNGGTRL
jgi:hypothetical protein